MSVDEYDSQFVKLPRFAPYMILDEKEKITRFIMGICDALYNSVASQMKPYPSYIVVVDEARIIELRNMGGDN